MTTKRRIGAEDSAVRAKLIKAATKLLTTEGYANFSARKVGAKAGLTPQLLYYYFKTMDDLLVAVIHDYNDHRLAQFEKVVASANSLRDIWNLTYSPAQAKLAAEFTTIAAHNKKVRAEIVNFVEYFRQLQIEAVSRFLPRKESQGDDVSSTVVFMVAFSLARLIVTESSLGISAGHQESLNFIERMLDRYQSGTDGNS